MEAHPSLSLVPSWTAGEGASPPGTSQGTGESCWGRINLEKGQETSHGPEEAAAGRDVGAGSRKDAHHHPRNQRPEPAMVARAPTPAFSLRTRTVGWERKICFLPGPTCFAFHRRFRPGAGKRRLRPSSRGLHWPGVSCHPAHSSPHGKTHPNGKVRLRRASHTILPIQSSEGMVSPR